MNQQSNERTLQQAMDFEYQLDVVIIGAKDCPESQELAKRMMSPKEAIQLQILPYANCSRNRGCICLYTFTARRDDRGRLIPI